MLEGMIEERCPRAAVCHCIRVVCPGRQGAAQPSLASRYNSRLKLFPDLWVPFRNSHMETGRTQATYFTGKVVDSIAKSITGRVDDKLDRIAKSVPELGPPSRVLDVGCGTGALIPHLQARGIKDILGVDVSSEMLDRLTEKFGKSPVLGNEPAVRTWLGDFMDLPAYYGPFDAVFFNAVFGNMKDPHMALFKATQFLRPGGRICISHPLGRRWLEQYRKKEPDIVPHPLPAKEDLSILIHDLPLAEEIWADERDYYCAVLRVPDRYTFPGSPLHFGGPVIHGFGRGSKQLGVPTANIPPDGFPTNLPNGVYFGFARVDAPREAPAEDSAVHAMVLNVGRRPTFRDSGEPEVSIEANIQHSFAQDFYGYQMKVVVLGFLRPEIKFDNLDKLMTQIHRDSGIAKSCLSNPDLAKYADEL